MVGRRVVIYRMSQLSPFAEFAATRLPERVQEALIEKIRGDLLVGYIYRDSTEIESREKPNNKEEQKENKSKRKRCSTRKVKKVKRESIRLEKQKGMNLDEVFDDSPMAYDVGTKINGKGYKNRWIGYKLHLDVADGGIPISCIITSASLHDSSRQIGYRFYY